MILELRDVIADYEILARQGLKLNQSYLEMLKTYNELNLAPNVVIEVQDSILKVIDSMQQDRDAIVRTLSDLHKSIQARITNIADISIVDKFQSIAQDCQTIGNFVKSIDLVDLEQMFINLIPQK